MLILSRSDQEKLVTMSEVMDCVSKALVEFSAERTVTPIRLALPFGKQNSSLVMPSVAENIATIGLKYVTVVPDNQVSGKTIQGVVLLSDIETGEPLALLEGSYLTLMRTGALSGVATNYLARKDATILGVIGTGEQAKGLCDAMFVARNIQTVYLYNRSTEKAEQFANDLRKQYDVDVYICEDSNELVEKAEIIITATSSKTPVFTDQLRPGTHVNAVGSFRPTMQELPTSAIEQAQKIVVEAAKAALEETGDLQVPIQEGVFHENDLHGELGNIIRKQLASRENEEEITIFKSVGLAIADIVVAQYIYEKALSENVGTRVEL